MFRKNKKNKFRMERQISNKLPYLNTKWTSLKKKK